LDTDRRKHSYSDKECHSLSPCSTKITIYFAGSTQATYLKRSQTGCVGGLDCHSHVDVTSSHNSYAIRNAKSRTDIGGQSYRGSPEEGDCEGEAESQCRWRLWKVSCSAFVLAKGIL